MAKLPWYIKTDSFKNGIWTFHIRTSFIIYCKIRYVLTFILKLSLEKIRGFDLIEKVKTLKNF